MKNYHGVVFVSIMMRNTKGVKIVINLFVKVIYTKNILISYIECTEY